MRHINGQARQAAAHGVHQPVTVGLQVGFQFGEPRCAFAVGDAGRFHAQRVDAVDHAAAGVVDAFAQGCVLDDHERCLEAGDVVSLAGRHQGDGALGDFRAQGGGRNVHAAIEAQLGMDLVGDDPGVLCRADIGHGLQLFTAEHLADRVVRVAQEQGAATVQRVTQGVERGGVGAVSLGDEFQFDLVQPPMARRMPQRRVVRHLHHDVLLRLHQGFQSHVEAGLNARQEDQLLRFDLPGELVPQVGDDGFTQVVLGHAVTHQRMQQTLLQGLDDHRRRGEIHISDPHRQNIGRVAAPLGAAGVVAVEYLIKIESHARSREGGMGPAGHSKPMARWEHTKPVGASLLAKAVCQSIFVSTDRASSRAGSLPQVSQRMTDCRRRSVFTQSVWSLSTVKKSAAILPQP
ncbi:hypothetical protein PseAD21_18070 [Pseudomonas sp. AD21]|nr:hypothetical protein PseAD21_18070 [Pseudomonas sp. AD21]